MGTRGIIARHTGTGTFAGVYHHWDSYPECLGATLFGLFNGHFQRDMKAMLEYLMDKHPAGYSTINGADFALPAGYADVTTEYELDADGEKDYSKPIPHGPRCYCHGKRNEEAAIYTQADQCGAEWAYAFAEHVREMYVYMALYQRSKGSSERALTWERVATVDLMGAEPDWKRIACGDRLERCNHVASYHFPELDGTPMERLGVQTFLGTEPLDPERDAYAYEYKGTVYKASRSGSSGTDARGRNVWLVSVEDKTLRFYGIRTYFGGYAEGYLPVVIRPQPGTRGKARMYPGVKPVFPPTLRDPLGVFNMIRQKQAETGAPSAEPSTSLLSYLVAPAPAPRKFRKVQ